MNHKDIKVSKVKKYCAYCLFLYSILMCLYSWLCFFSTLFAGQYGGHLGPLEPLFGAVIIFLTGRCLIGKNQWYAPILGGIISFCLLIIPSQIELSPIEPEVEKAECNTIEGVREFIQNKVWTYTDPIEEGEKFNMWCRIVFKDGKVYYYQVSPSKGKWGEPHICDYTIEEGRYSNTGEKYVAIRWEASWGKYSFVPETGALYCALGRQIYSCQTDCQDRNPWD